MCVCYVIDRSQKIADISGYNVADDSLLVNYGQVRSPAQSHHSLYTGQGLSLYLKVPFVAILKLIGLSPYSSKFKGKEDITYDSRLPTAWVKRTFLWSINA